MKTSTAPRITLTLRDADCTTDLLTIRVTARNAVAAAEQIVAAYYAELRFGRACQPRIYVKGSGLTNLRPAGLDLWTLTASTLIAPMRAAGLAV